MRCRPTQDVGYGRIDVASRRVNLGAVLLQAASTDPDGVALVAPDRVTFAALALTSGRLAAHLVTDIRPGDRVALLAGNELSFVQAYLATLIAGGVVVPLNGTSPSLELA